MFEVEAKFRVKSHKEFEEILRIQKAFFLGEYDQKDQYFDFFDQRLTDSGMLLRIRRMKDSAVLTFKSESIDGDNRKARVEHEVSIGDGEIMKEILLSIGCKIIVEISKKRRSYELDHSQIELDQVENLGSFIEIALLTGEGKDVLKARSSIDDIMKLLHLTNEDLMQESYMELMLKSKSK